MYEYRWEIEDEQVFSTLPPLSMWLLYRCYLTWGVSSLVIRCGISLSLLIGGKIRNFVNDLLFLKA